MNYRVKTYNPVKILDFNTIKEAKKYINDCGYNMDIDKRTINCQITDGNIPQIIFERINNINELN